MVAPRTLHFRERFVADANAVAVGEGCLNHEVAHDAEPFAGERALVCITLIGNWLPAVRHGRHFVAGIGAGEDFEHGRRVRYGAADRPAAVARE